MFNNYKMIKKLEDKISKLEAKIPDEYDIKDIANGIIMAERAKLSEIDEAREDARDEAWEAIASKIDDIVEQRLPVLVEEATKDIQDKLIVELARKAMNLEVKNEI